MKDVKLPLNSPTQLLLEKHADFIAAYGKKKDDYVSNIIFYVMVLYIKIDIFRFLLVFNLLHKAFLLIDLS